MNFHNVVFETSFGRFDQLPKSDLVEIAFAGRSNVGKSSMINKVFNRKQLARVSAVPGKTATINFFRLESVRFADLPGYGYAKVPKAEKDRWARLMEDYFAAEGLITLGIMIVDARHAPTALDKVMADWFMQSGAPFLVVANKLDKLKKSEIAPNMQRIADELGLPDVCHVLPFSAQKGDGRTALVELIEQAAQGQL